ncbi:Disintegrin and metalloproteinase domain-containing protein 18 [Apodemus speciosus]|uniref:Disintegrin and metalloproteinase domain-containing protein 18 n=1 Tax=Apodemus speciosus TaxID=105296 RepID=A0ABQ0F177_APOSI
MPAYHSATEDRATQGRRFRREGDLCHYHRGEALLSAPQELLIFAHCHYQGYVDEVPNSVVTLSICSGLRGFLQLENISYGIEPLESSARFEHIVYQVRNNNSMIAENYSHIWQAGQLDKGPFNEQDKNHSQLLPRSLKLHIIVGKFLFDYMGSDTMAITQKIFQIIGLVNTFTGDTRNTSERYHRVEYAVKAMLRVLLCYPEDIGLEGFSVVIAQLIGLHIGLTYDDDDDNNCSCPRAPCIMQQRALSSSGMKTFSNCSLHDYMHYASKFDMKCLSDLSNVHILQPKQAVCGDGIMEAGEECDCGNKTECQFKECCDHETCRLKGSARCGSGACCTPTCELSAAGTPCRKAVDPECDFTEYCDGTSSHCVPDTFALNGHLCRLGSAYCYNGRCQALNDQCVSLFGKGSQGASYACFEKVNPPSENQANCDSKNSYSLPCGQQDVLCGKLACFRPHKNYKSPSQSVVYSYVHDRVCLSVPPGLSMKSDGRDSAYVADGTVCGPQMYCINGTCKEVNFTGNDCNATKKCKGNGICNNFGNCQCFPDYRPPDCKFQIGSPGGSIDDGNVLRADTALAAKRLNKHQDSWVILGFFIFLPFIITALVGVLKRNERKVVVPQREEEM